MEANPGEKWDEYMAAWNAVAYRFHAMAEHDENFRTSLSTKGFDDRYVQERELFGFFVTGLSAIEAFGYGLHFLLSIAYPANFPVDKRRDITIPLTTRCLQATKPDEPLTSCLHSLLDNQKFKDWKEIRDILAHRGAPGRIISLGSPEGDIWKLKNIQISLDLTRGNRSWLAGNLGELFDKAWLFVEKNV
jgi:hypothetical protein